jgi:hypothetical protein
MASCLVKHKDNFTFMFTLFIAEGDNIYEWDISYLVLKRRKHSRNLTT